MVVASLVGIFLDRRLATIFCLNTEGHFVVLAAVGVCPISHSGEADDIGLSRTRQRTRDAVAADLAIERIRGGALLEASARSSVLIRTALSAIRKVFAAAATNQAIELLGMEGSLLELIGAWILAVILPVTLDMFERLIGLRIARREAPTAATRSANLTAALSSRPLCPFSQLVSSVGSTGSDSASAGAVDLRIISALGSGLRARLRIRSRTYQV